MRKIISGITLALIACSSAVAEENSPTSDTISVSHKVTGTASVDVVSRYIWRGQESGDASIQPSMSIGNSPFLSSESSVPTPVPRRPIFSRASPLPHGADAAESENVLHA